MALTLEDLMAVPTDPEQMNKHLQDRGLLPSPATEPAPIIAPMTPPAPDAPTVATMKPPTVGPLEKEAMAKYGADDPFGRSVRIGTADTVRPNIAPMKAPGNVEAPDLGGTPGGGAPTLSGIAPMSPPNLTHDQKMALPTTSAAAPIGSAAHTEAELARLEEEKANPWGTAENHPGILGKIGHVAGKIGNIALDALAPGIGMNIPGTDLNRRLEESNLKHELATRTAAEGNAKNQASEAALRGANVRNIDSEIEGRSGKQELISDPDGNVTGWKDAKGIHAVTDADTPQAIKDIAESGQKRPHYEKDGQGNIVELKRDESGKTTSEVVYKGQPNQKTETRTVLGDDGKPHEQVFDITPGSQTFGKKLADLGRSKEDKAPSLTQDLAKEKAGQDPVIGYDKNGVQRLMPKSQAESEGLNHVVKATPKDREDAMQNTSALNDMEAKVRNVMASRKALDQNAYQKTLIQEALAGNPDDWSTRIVTSQMSELSKQYVTDVHSLREAALALPKQTTGGSRVSEPQAKALWNTVPGTAGDAKYGEMQLRKFDENLTRLWKKVPMVEGNDREKAFVEEERKAAAGGGQSIKMGGKEIPLGPDGTFEYNGKTYKTTPGSKTATLVTGK